MHGHDGSRFRRNRLLDLLLVHIEGVGPDVYKNGTGPAQDEGVGRGDEREGRYDDFVPGPDVAENRGHFQCGRTRMGQQGLAAAQGSLQPPMALFCKGTVPGEVGGDHDRLSDIVQLLPDDERFVEGDPRVAFFQVVLPSFPMEWKASNPVFVNAQISFVEGKPLLDDCRNTGDQRMVRHVFRNDGSRGCLNVHADVDAINAGRVDAEKTTLTDCGMPGKIYGRPAEGMGPYHHMMRDEAPGRQEYVFTYTGMHVDRAVDQYD